MVRSFEAAAVSVIAVLAAGIVAWIAWPGGSNSPITGGPASASAERNAEAPSASSESAVARTAAETDNNHHDEVGEKPGEGEAVAVQKRSGKRAGGGPWRPPPLPVDDSDLSGLSQQPVAFSDLPNRLQGELLSTIDNLEQLLKEEERRFKVGRSPTISPWEAAMITRQYTRARRNLEDAEHGYFFALISACQRGREIIMKAPFHDTPAAFEKALAEGKFPEIQRQIKPGEHVMIAHGKTETTVILIPNDGALGYKKSSIAVHDLLLSQTAYGLLSQLHGR